MVSRSRSRRWTREELVIVFNLYLRIPFKNSNKSHPDVRYIANLIGRTPDAVNMKIGNFGSLDPELKNLGIRGLSNVSRLDQAVWNEFHDDWQSLIEESERLIHEREREEGLPTNTEEGLPTNTNEVPKDGGRDRLVVRRVREDQHLFRTAILSAYDSRCCVTGLDVESLLVASHIKPWVESDKTERLNPQNGLCLNALHDRAFDRGIISMADDYSVLVSKQVAHSTSSVVQEWLLNYDGRRITLPSRFAPRPDFLSWHRENVFLG